MSKNMTRKGLAFGAGLSLAMTGLVAAPASAAIENFVTLAPSSGFEDAYAVIAGPGKTFSLTAVAGATAIHTDKEMKFLVTDPEAVFEPTVGSVGRTALTIDETAAADLVFIDVSTNYVTVKDATGNITSLAEGDVIVLDASLTVADDVGGADDGGDAEIVLAADTAYEVLDVTGATFTVESKTADVIAMTADSGGTAANPTGAVVDSNDDPIVKVIREARNADNSFVVDSGDADGTVPALILATPDGETRTVTVQAFTDFIENDKIDSLDYVSPARTVTFVAKADLTGTVSLTPPNIGETSLVASFSTSPVLNGDQVGQNDLFGVVFTRQDSDQKPIVKVGSASQDAVTGLYSATVSLGDVTNLLGWVDKATAVAAIDLTGVDNGLNDWNFQLPTGRAGFDGEDAAPASDPIQSIAVATTGVVTVTTLENHYLRSGDKITMAVDAADDVDSAAQATAVAVTVTGPKSFTYTLTATTKPAAAESDTDLQTATAYSISNAQIDEVFPGDYSATLALNLGAQGTNLFDALSLASTFGTQAVLADDVEFSTVGSASLQGSKVTSADTDTDALAKEGTTSVTVTATVVDEDDAAVGAGRSVAWSFAVGANTTIKVNGIASGVATTPLKTDANGQVTFTVTDTTGADGKKVTITATPEGVDAAASKFTLEWDEAAVKMYDLNVSDSAALATGNRYVAPGASYDMALFVADQWYQPVADADYRLAVTGSGVSEGFVTLSSGKATVTVTDAEVATSFDSTVTVQKKSATTGLFAATTTTATITTKTTDKATLTLGANGTALYGGVTVDTADAVAKLALVERDTRVAFTAQPLYVNDVVLAGKATFTATGASVGKSVVAISGPTSILFSNGAVDKRGGITIVSDANGEFSVNLYSTTAQTDSVITVTANGVSKTIKVTFTGLGVGEGTALTVTAPAAVKPASTFQVKAKLADVYGNGVDTAAGRVKVTYTGPGIIFGTLPTETDANGELSFSVLLGSNDTGNVVVQVQYDQNGDADYVDAKDLSATSTTAISASGAVASADQKVNAGSFKGYVALYAKGYAGQRMSAKVGNDWVVVPVLASNFERVVEFTGAGYTVAVRIYIDRVLIDTITVTTK